MGTAFAICRAVKIKSLSALKAHANHATRSRPTPNADSSVTPINPVLVGSGDPANDAQILLNTLPKPPRKNGVLAIEVLLTASPEFFRPDDPHHAGHFDIERTKQFNAKAISWLWSQFGFENVASVICHLDESTPHLSATIVPIDKTPRKRGHNLRLNASRWLDGKKRLQGMQDSFADAMAELGLQRGRKGSKARHQDVKKYYGRMKELPVLEAKLEAAIDLLKETNKTNKPHTKRRSQPQLTEPQQIISKAQNKAVHGAIGVLERSLETGIDSTSSFEDENFPKKERT